MYNDNGIRDRIEERENDDSYDRQQIKIVEEIEEELEKTVKIPERFALLKRVSDAIDILTISDKYSEYASSNQHKKYLEEYAQLKKTQEREKDDDER